MSSPHLHTPARRLPWYAKAARPRLSAESHLESSPGGHARAEICSRLWDPARGNNSILRQLL